MLDYGDFFKGISLMPGTAKLHLRPDAALIVIDSRNVPETLKDCLKAKLESMEREHISKVTDTHTD